MLTIEGKWPEVLNHQIIIFVTNSVTESNIIGGMSRVQWATFV